jgi:hypothetical protein
VLEFTLRHEIACSEPRFWELFFDEAFTHDMIVKGLDFGTCDIEPVKEAGDRKTRVMRVIPKLDVPAPVAKLLGPKLGYTEEGTFFITKELWTYTLRLSVLSERIRLGGKLRIEPIDDTKCWRISELWCEVRILGLGKMVEKAAEKNMRDGWNKSAAWMNGWLAEQTS